MVTLQDSPYAATSRSITRLPSAMVSPHIKHGHLRANFTLSTLLAIGASLQAVLFVLPIRPTYVCAPALLYVASSTIWSLLVKFGILHNTRIDDIIHGPTSALLPSGGPKNSSPVGDKICVVLISARFNGALGVFEPSAKVFAKYLSEMFKHLEGHASTNGFLGGSTWSNISDRKSSPSTLAILYFRDMDAVHEFGEAPPHREAWDWWRKEMADRDHLSLSHEAFEAPKGQWETIYLNTAPTGLGRLQYPVKDSTVDEITWLGGLWEAKRGPLASSKGRLGQIFREKSSEE